MKITKFLKIMRGKPVLYQRFTNLVELLLISLSESNMLSPKIVDNEETQLYKKAINTLEEKMSFSSQNYFSVVFKRKVGISPLQYKKKKEM